VTPAPSYEARDRRAAHLIGERPHAAQLLEFYRQVLELQEQVYRDSAATGWPLTAVDGASRDTFGSHVRDLPWQLLVEEFRGFAGAMAAAAPGPARMAGERLRAAPADLLEAALAGIARRDSTAGAAADLGSREVQVELYGRAFLQPWAEALRRGRALDDGETADGEPALCRGCAWPAQVSVISDDAEGRGGRTLVCALCGFGWSYGRVRCAHCGERDAERLALHEVEGTPHLQVETCTSCKRYLKRVDLRRLGNAVPVVEDLASPELDLWARQRGLQKVCENLLAL
jgi:formate dehydrogenase accessory protein FdhE